MRSATNLTQDINEISFPWLNEGIAWVTGDRNVSITSLNRTNTPFLRLQWLPLPAKSFGNIITGLLVELPSSADSRVAFGCSISAIWIQANVHSDSAFSQYAWISQITTDYSKQHIVTNLSATLPNAKRMNRLIMVDPGWLNALTTTAPDVADDDSWSPTTLERIMIDTRIYEIFEDYCTRPQLYAFSDGQCKLEATP